MKKITRRRGIKQASKEGSQTEFTALSAERDAYNRQEQQKNNKMETYLFRMQDEN